ncbi:MAG: polysaccharide deacetylase family protein [Bacteroidales bacterium]|nr:polysaccharide deacetylase family protein [Bacteroidales bacterium]
MLIERPPLLYRLFYPDAVFLAPGEKKVAYLTFDDGPIPEATPWVLDVLDSYRVKATFFMVGDNVRKYPYLYEEVIKRGHKVGNHTMHHLQGLKVTTEEYLSDIAIAADYIKSRLFRPPHGFIGLSQAKRVARDYRLVMYDLITRDYSRRLTSQEVFENVRKYTRNGSIIVFHDSIKSMPRLKDALPRSIEWLQSQGYELAMLDKLEKY